MASEVHWYAKCAEKHGILWLQVVFSSKGVART